MRLILVKLACQAFVLLMASFPASFSYAEVASGSQVLEININPEAGGDLPAQATLKLVSINLAHGRKDGLNQWLVSDKKIRQNLDDIAAFLQRVGADIVALQEADGPSAWSGGFNHVAYLAEKAGFPYYIYTEHAQITMGNYGTAMLSRMPMTEAMGFTFSPSWPTANKGFTLAAIEWRNPGVPSQTTVLDVISVHLDFSRKSVRRKQIDELIAVVKPRKRPIVIMGDFNSQWPARKYTVDSFAKESPVHVFEPDNENLNTYKDKRLDWIIMSRDLDFMVYENEQLVLSDHKAVITTISLSGEVQ